MFFGGPNGFNAFYPDRIRLNTRPPTVVLTALSILFAVYLVKPSPFCLLDEADAPLDDTNIGRFVNMLREPTSSYTNVFFPRP